jgi:hypothetical protein
MAERGTRRQGGARTSQRGVLLMDALDPAWSGTPVPAAFGLVAWTIDPLVATVPATLANVRLGGVFLKAGTAIAGLSVPVLEPGWRMTHAQLGVYDADLRLAVASADSPAAFERPGWVALRLDAPYVVPADGLYYLASAYAGGRLPTVLSVAQTKALSLGLPDLSRPRGVHAQEQGTLPETAVSTGPYTYFPCIVAF